MATSASGASSDAQRVPHQSRDTVPRLAPDGVQTAWIRVLRRLVGWLQRCIYRRVMQTRIEGGEHVPRGGAFLVATNHASHLDAGLVKMALGRRGDALCALAAYDYFFAKPWRRWYFTNLTNIIPIERQGGFRASLKRALVVLRRGAPLLIFPEGTRSLTGEMAPFKPAISSMALAADCPILPIYLDGTHRALPKGRYFLPRSRRIAARVGPAIPAALLRRFTDDLPRHEAYRLATRAVELAVHSLAEGRPLAPETVLARLAPARAASLREHNGPHSGSTRLAGIA